MGDGGNDRPGTAAPREEPALQIDTSRQLTSWLAEHRVSLAFTTYQSGKLFFVGAVS